MNLAVVGVGLIGGSIGLAARERLGARVSGYDPAPGTVESQRVLSARILPRELLPCAPGTPAGEPLAPPEALGPNP